MKILSIVLVLSFASLASFAAYAVQDGFEPAKPTAEHEWLQQLVGEWTMTMEAQAGPDMEPMKIEATESVRSLGDLWVIAEGTMPMGAEPMRTVMTLGYDARKKAFLGTWIDTFQSHMWVYRGELDEAKKVLTLKAEGPSMTDPSATALYRDSIEIVDADHKVLRASVQGEDGTWTTFMVAHYRRKK